MKIGYHTIGWHAPLDEVVSRIAQLGFQGVEAYDLAGFLEDEALEQRVIAAFARTRISFSGAFFGASLVEPDRLEDEEEFFHRNARYIRRLGGELAVVGGGKIRQDSELLDRPQLYKATHRLAEVALSEGLKLAFHPHAGTLVHTPQEIEQFAERTDPTKVWFAFDTAHLKSGGGDPVRLFERYLLRLTAVHLKDLRAGSFCELGEGDLDLTGVFRVLQDGGYAGWVIVELDEPEDAHRSALINLRFLQEKLGVLLPDPGSSQAPDA
ncbi:MAG: TIM barrel protein [Verrucomicrobia bacterium]|nr:TIM barrel protein [Verrucomicrobiota bacterium]